MVTETRGKGIILFKESNMRMYRIMIEYDSKKWGSASGRVVESGFPPASHGVCVILMSKMNHESRRVFLVEE